MFDLEALFSLLMFFRNILLNLTSCFFRDFLKNIQGTFSMTVIFKKEFLMDNTTLLILEQLKHMFKERRYFLEINRS